MILLVKPDPGVMQITHPLAITNTPFLDWWDNISDTATFRVLHVPPQPVEVGQEFGRDALTDDVLDSAPLDTILADGVNDVAVKRVRGWVTTGGETLTPSDLIDWFDFPVRALAVGTD
ncbi:MAG: hypothetical protein EKK42_20230 [Pseudonocardiaceae bacterium]|nr:MAG: hypothetical protein EKK42_20230 [Pseudonocardiaceae bacterium]